MHKVSKFSLKCKHPRAKDLLQVLSHKIEPVLSASQNEHSDNHLPCSIQSGESFVWLVSKLGTCSKWTVLKTRSEISIKFQYLAKTDLFIFGDWQKRDRQQLPHAEYRHISEVAGNRESRSVHGQHLLTSVPATAWLLLDFRGFWRCHDELKNASSSQIPARDN